MTKVQTRFELARPIEDDFACIGKANSVYGINRVTIAPSLDAIVVDYDASRLTLNDLRAALVRSGVPVKIAPAV